MTISCLYNFTLITPPSPWCLVFYPISSCPWGYTNVSANTDCFYALGLFLNRELRSWEHYGNVYVTRQLQEAIFRPDPCLRTSVEDDREGVTINKGISFYVKQGVSIATSFLVWKCVIQYFLCVYESKNIFIGYIKLWYFILYL